MSGAEQDPYFVAARPAQHGGDRHPAAAPGVSPAPGLPASAGLPARPRPTRRPRLIPPGTRSRCPWRSRRRAPHRSRRSSSRVGTAARIAATRQETGPSARSATARRASLRPARCRPSPRRAGGSIWPGGDLLPLGDWLRSGIFWRGRIGLFLACALTPFLLLQATIKNTDARYAAWGFTIYFAVIWLIAIRALIRPEKVPVGRFCWSSSRRRR